MKTKGPPPRKRIYEGPSGTKSSSGGSSGTVQLFVLRTTSLAPAERRSPDQSERRTAPFSANTVQSSFHQPGRNSPSTWMPTLAPLNFSWISPGTVTSRIQASSVNPSSQGIVIFVQETGAPGEESSPPPIGPSVMGGLSGGEDTSPTAATIATTARATMIPTFFLTSRTSLFSPGYLFWRVDTLISPYYLQICQAQNQKERQKALFLRKKPDFIYNPNTCRVVSKVGTKRWIVPSY